MNGPTTPTTREQSGFDRALGEYLHARDTLNALPVETTTQADETLAMDAMGAAEQRLFNQTPQNIADVRALAEIAWNDPDSLPGLDLIGAVMNGLTRLDSAPSRTFRAANWLHQFEGLGGGWANHEGRVTLLTPVPASDGLQTMLWELDTRGGREQVKAAILAHDKTVVTPASEYAPSVQWQHLRQRFEEQAERMRKNEATPYTGTIDDPDCEKAEALTAEICDAYDEVADALLRFPSPDAKALRFKLALLAGERFTIGHHPDYAAFATQVRDDADRLFSGEA